MVEGGLFGVALLLALIFDSSLIDQYQWGWREALIGLVAVVPMLGMFYECLRSQIASMKEIRSYLELHMRPMFERLSVLQLAALSILAGLGEEALFRGVIQHNLEGPIGLFGAMLISNVLFGFAHFMTKAYFLLALMIGFFLAAFILIPKAC
jgi:membrane protease YdiL (CAAX protease family)